MAIVKLVCQGCGANLDAPDNNPVMQCGYCGTTNQIKRTVYNAPPAPAPKPMQPAHYTPQVQVQGSQVTDQGRGVRRGVLAIILITTLLPLLAGGFIFYMVFSTTKSALEDVGISISGGKIGFASPGGGAGARKYRWDTGRPFVADVNGDGTDDLIGAIVESGSQQLLLTAMSGSDWATLWEVDLGKNSDLPNPVFYFEPETRLVLLNLGASLHAYEGGSGAQRWQASLPDKLETIASDGGHLWVATIDDAGHEVSLADGKVRAAKSNKPSPTAKPLRDAEGYELIPELRELDLKYDQFADLRVQQAFCPERELPVARGRRHRADSKRCANPHGLAFVTRDKGTQVPYLLGYARETKAETWRVQLTKAGTLETVDGGFGQPRAEFIGDDAIVSFVPANDDNAHIRRISLGDGATKWEVTLTKQSTENVDGMVAGGNIVFVTYGQSIHALSLDDGRELARLGGW